MADKMLRVAVRGEDGKAKAVNSDNDGRIKTKIYGINASDASTGEAISYIEDESGIPALRVVNAAPHAYDAETNSLRVRPQKGSILETIGGKTLPDNTWVQWTFETTDESEVYVLVRINKKPWTMRGSLINSIGPTSERAFYPLRSNVNLTAGYGQEVVSKYLGLASPLESAPASWQDANAMAVPPGNRTITVDIRQTSGEEGSAELYVVRVWR